MKTADLLGLEVNTVILLFWFPLCALESLLWNGSFKPGRLEMHRWRCLMVGTRSDQESGRRWNVLDLQWEKQRERLTGQQWRLEDHGNRGDLEGKERTAPEHRLSCKALGFKPQPSPDQDSLCPDQREVRRVWTENASIHCEPLKTCPSPPGRLEGWRKTVEPVCHLFHHLLTFYPQYHGAPPRRRREGQLRGLCWPFPSPWMREISPSTSWQLQTQRFYTALALAFLEADAVSGPCSLSNIAVNHVDSLPQPQKVEFAVTDAQEWKLREIKQPCLGHEEGTATHSRILAWRIPTDRRARQATVHGVTKSWTWLSD